MSADGDSLQYSAPQSYVNSILVPCAIGWGLQLFLGGIATSHSISLLLKRRHDDRTRNISGIPLAKSLLWLATLSNLFAVVVTYWEFARYMILQDRSTAQFADFKMADVVAPLPTALAGVFTQAFMAIRYWRVANRSYIFAVLTGSGILLAFAGGIWMTVDYALYYHDRIDLARSYLPGCIWLWTTVAIDTVITVVLTVRLLRMKKGFNPQTDRFIDSLVKLGLETCALPWLTALTTALLYSLADTYPACGNWVSATLTPISSLYVLSFVYCLQATFNADPASASNTRVTVTPPSWSARAPVFTLSPAKQQQAAFDGIDRTSHLMPVSPANSHASHNIPLHEHFAACLANLSDAESMMGSKDNLGEKENNTGSIRVDIEREVHVDAVENA